MTIRATIMIREMQENDIKYLIEIFCFPWSSVAATTQKWEQYHEEHKECARVVYLIEMQGKIIGYGSLLRNSKYSGFKGIPEIHDVWISAEYRGKGFGKELVLHLEKMARRDHHKQIGIGVGLYKDYGPAQQLYIHLGYVPDGQGVTYNYQPVIPGNSYIMDDDLVLWLKKDLP